MKLEKLILENYRGYQERTEIVISELTALIGRNDVGKTTVLDALGVFFGHKLCKYDISDKCVYAALNDDVKIGCVFSGVPERLVLDASSQTTFSNEYLLNSDGHLELHKIYKKGKGAGAIYAYCRHPSARGVKGILLKKNDELKAIAQSLSISVEDRRSNVSLRQAIYQEKDDLRLTDQLVSLSKEDGKAIWEQIQTYLPHFALFRADRPSTDEESEVQDPMKAAVVNALDELESDLNDIKQRVKEKALAVATNTINHLNDIDPNLAQQLAPEFKAEPKWDSIFKLSLVGDDGIHINKRGSGVRRLILISFFKAEAERIKQENSGRGVIYAIEEPETSQHPSNQKLLLEAFSELASLENCQVLLTTHVPALAGQLPLESIRHIHRNASGDLAITQDSDSVYEYIAKDLGVLPDSRAQVFLCLEGPNDVNFFKGMSRILLRDGAEVPDLNSDPRVVLLPLGGSTLKDWVNRHYLKNVGKPEIHIYDRDTEEPPKYQQACERVNTRGDGSIAFLTSKREAENYLHVDAIKQAFQLEIDLEIDGQTDIPNLLVEHTPYRESNVKKKLNSRAVSFMSKELLEQVDTNGEVLEWFNAINSRLS
ncbi:ATP-binding protein [Vibrio parahaemolyticus]|nr:ATP-binding protein [Vibrio parahaemolyticus]MDF4522983.1 ATP-binding protein [Vibrio parahaemolyticus]MDF4541013.1 ATP-binding protein [Vibrio parahaemolyticus]MDF4550163.1 ATP-binding protein [Vibrio parahaemolyticus]